MGKRFRFLLMSAAAGLLIVGGAHATPYQHVLLISVDGMHAFDLANYIDFHPSSNLAQLVRHGVVYPHALTSGPSDSFPGLLAQVTGGTSRSTGVYYDVSYDRTFFGPGSNCAGSPGWAAAFDESIDKDQSATNGGGTLGQPLTQINAGHLPMTLSGGACVSVYPHNFIKVNTIFEVIKNQLHRRTAWADKHPAYDIVNEPSGTGVDDLFTPEVNSNDATTGQDTTKGFHSVQRNDALKVQAVLNEIDGYASTDNAHATSVGVPAVFGMNFQAVSVGEKLPAGNPHDPADAGLTGGYADANGAVPNSGLQSGLDFVDNALGQFVAELSAKGLSNSTLIVISAKHGQSPVNRADEKPFDDSPYGATPGIGSVGSQGSGSYTTDDVGLVWLAPNMQKSNYSAAKNYLTGQKPTLGITTLLDKGDLAPTFGDPLGNSRTPDFIAVTEHGLIYTSNPPKKLAEHGGFDSQDRNVALLISNPSINPQTNNTNVETRQIAPTILTVLGIDPKALRAVQLENTLRLPGQY
jgi:predicted AlkP superfamily pyrophosphatase or phosphodiesterase